MVQSCCYNYRVIVYNTAFSRLPEKSGSLFCVFEEIEKNTYNMVGGTKIFQNIIGMIIPADKILHTNGIKTNRQLVLPVCSNQNIIVLR